MNYSAFAGFPAPLTNGGLNEHHVAGRDVWSPSRDELRKMTPKPQTGLNYSDLSRIAMERARTAREAVEIVGELIDEVRLCHVRRQLAFLRGRRRGLGFHQLRRRTEAVGRAARRPGRSPRVASRLYRRGPR